MAGQYECGHMFWVDVMAQIMCWVRVRLHKGDEGTLKASNGVWGQEQANGGKCIVFTETKHNDDRLAFTLQKSFRCEALHGDISQSQRERTLSGFRDGRFNVLVAANVLVALRS